MLWPYAVRHYTYIYNRLVRQGETTSAAKRVMANIDDDLTALPTFGTDGLILDHDHARSAKASTPRREGIMLGVAQGSYAFDVLCQQQHSTRLSCIEHAFCRTCWDKLMPRPPGRRESRRASICKCACYAPARSLFQSTDTC